MKNTFKKPTITYDPIQQPKEPLWMHSVEKHETRNHGILYYIILMSFPLAILLIYLILG